MLDVTSPYTQERIARIPYDEGALLESKVARAHATQVEWRRVPLEQRISRVKQGLDRFLAEGEAIAREVSLQMGKPIREARSEVNTLADRARFLMAVAEDALSPELLPPRDGFHRRIEHAPLGVVLDIAAWNYPLIIPINVIVPALVAGNTVLLKHSARTPLTGDAFERAFGAADELRLVQNLVLTHGDTDRLISDPRIAYVAFTGSTQGGAEIYRAASKRFIDCGLELGGKDPAYVAADADLEFAIANVVDGACYNAGQSCCAVERVYVHRRVHSEFVERARALLAQYVFGDPLDETTTLGPLASRRALDVLEAQVEDAVRDGARLILGGRRSLGSAGNSFPPTLVDGARNSSLIMQEESFGPTLPVLAVDGDDEAIAHMNDSRYGLSASIWTSDLARADRIAREIEAGTVYQNRCDYLDPALPWTGWKDSGKGSTLSRHGYFHLTKRKSIHFRTRTS
jgi:acyl-CoA reductase-like NAD-dependent aldehyde dehydrogenase